MPVYDIQGIHQIVDEYPLQESHSQEEADKDVEDSLQLERDYRSSQDQWAAQAIEDEAFTHNVQFTKTQEERLKERGQSASPVNMIYPAVEQAVAMLTTNKPRFQATAREDSDVRTARAMSELLTWVWQESFANQELKTAIWDYYVKGRGVLHFYFHPEKNFGNGEICIQSLNPLEVYPDPNSQDRLWRDAAHILVSRIMTHEQIETMWPDAKPLLDGAQTTRENAWPSVDRVAYEGQQFFQDDVSDGHHEKYRVITRYSKVKLPYYNIKERFSGEELLYLEEDLEAYYAQPAIIMGSNGEQQVVTGNDIQQVMPLWEQGREVGEDTRLFVTPDQVDPASGQVIPGQAITMQLVSFADLLDMGMIEQKKILQNRIKVVYSIGDKLYRKHYLPLEDYPIVPLNNRHNRNPYPMSDVRFVRPIQMEVNRLSSLVIANLASSTNVKAFVPRGSVDMQQVKQDWAKAGGAIIEYDHEMTPPTIAQPVSVPNAAFGYIETKKKEIQEILGIHSLMQGDASAAPATHKGTIAIEQFGQRRIRSKLDDIELALNHMARTMIPLMQWAYTAEKIIRIIQPNNVMSETVLNQPIYDDYGQVIEKMLDLTTGRYDLVVVTGSTLPSNRFALLDYYMELYQAGLIDQIEVLKKTDVADMEGVINRSSQMAQLQQALGTAQEEVKKLEGDMQTADREIVHLKRQLQVEKGTRKMDATVNRQEYATALYQERLKDEERTRKQVSSQSQQSQ